MIALTSYTDIIHIIVTAMLVAIIWIIQLLHYPSFRFVDTDKASAFHEFHTRSITPIVAPLMVIELVIVSLNLYHHLSMINMLLFSIVTVIWCSTFLIQVPIHAKLTTNYSSMLIDRLIKTNWIRTFCWTAKLLLITYISVLA